MIEAKARDKGVTEDFSILGGEYQTFLNGFAYGNLRLAAPSRSLDAAWANRFRLSSRSASVLWSAI